MKPFIVLHGSKYYPSGWHDYAGEADTLEEAREIAEAKDAEELGRVRTLEIRFYWWEIIDLRLKECVLTRSGDDPPYDPRSS